MEIQSGTDRRPAAATPATSKAVARPDEAGDAGSGKAAPATGKELPVRAPAPPAAAVQKAVAQIQNFLRDSRRELEFQLDDSSGRMVIRVVNPASGELIRQIPGDEVLQIAAAIEADRLQLIDRSA